jgi:hypothetical protein
MPFVMKIFLHNFFLITLFSINGEFQLNAAMVNWKFFPISSKQQKGGGCRMNQLFRVTAVHNFVALNTIYCNVKQTSTQSNRIISAKTVLF